GGWPVLGCRSSVGAWKAARILPDRRWRYLRRVFAAEICAAQTAFRCGIRSPENSITRRRQDSRNQFGDAGKTLAIISAAIVGQAPRLPTRETATPKAFGVALQSIASE